MPRIYHLTSITLMYSWSRLPAISKNASLAKWSCNIKKILNNFQGRHVTSNHEEPQQKNTHTKKSSKAEEAVEQLKLTIKCSVLQKEPTYKLNQNKLASNAFHCFINLRTNLTITLGSRSLPLMPYECIPNPEIQVLKLSWCLSLLNA